MSTRKSFDLVCVVVLVFTVLLTILFMNGSALGLETVVDEDAEYNSGSVYFTRNDLSSDWDSSGATVITLKGDSALVSGAGAYAYNGDVVIANAGKYVIRGTLTDGSIIVDTNRTAKVWILLDGVDIRCSDDACLRIDQADKVFLTLAEGSVNSMASGESYSDEALADNTGGTVYAHDDLAINGSGSLCITSAYKHGIDANDELVITGGTITVDAVGDGLHVRDNLSICDASITLAAGDDGVDINSEIGYFYMSSGALDITSGDDGIHTACPVIVEGGEIVVTAAADAIHSDASISVAGGTILVRACYEGLEALTIDVSGGDITVFCTDDGFNANGGSSFGMGGPGMWGGQSGSAETAESTETWIRISGGSVTVVNEKATDADGLDSNGDIIITGGTIRISLPGSGSNNAIDYGSESGGVCEISGGDLVACGSYAMAEGFSDSSTQPSVMYNTITVSAAGTQISLEDADGNVLLSYEAPCSFSSVTLSSPELKLGESYLVVIGEKAEWITLEEVSASYGNAQSEGFGGTMNWGGMQHRERLETDENSGEFRQRGDRENGGMQSSDGQDFGGTRPDMGERPTPPEGSDMPTPPEGSEMPTPPEMGANGEMPTPPDFGGSFQPGSSPEGGEPGVMQQTQADEDVSAAVTNGPQTVSPATWTLIAACFLVLFLGILLAVRYRR